MALGLEVAVAELEIQLLSSGGGGTIKGLCEPPRQRLLFRAASTGWDWRGAAFPPVGDPGLGCSPNPREGLAACAASPVSLLGARPSSLWIFPCQAAVI